MSSYSYLVIDKLYWLHHYLLKPRCPRLSFLATAQWPICIPPRGRLGIRLERLNWICVPICSCTQIENGQWRPFRSIASVIERKEFINPHLKLKLSSFFRADCTQVRSQVNSLERRLNNGCSWRCEFLSLSNRRSYLNWRHICRWFRG